MREKAHVNFCDDDVVIVTENADGRIYTITAGCAQDILDDRHGNCNFVPANDARVFFAVWAGKPLSPYDYSDFESLLHMLCRLSGTKEIVEAGMPIWYVDFASGYLERGVVFNAQYKDGKLDSVSVTFDVNGDFDEFAGDAYGECLFSSEESAKEALVRGER